MAILLNSVVMRKNCKTFLLVGFNFKFMLCPQALLVKGPTACDAQQLYLITIIWEANHPYSQLRAELPRTPLKKQACKGAFASQPHQPIMTTKHSRDQKCLILPVGRKPGGQANPWGTAENQRTTQLTYSPGRESNQGHLGERRALNAQANHSPKIDCLY